MAQSQKNAQPDVEAATFPIFTTEENWHEGNSGEWWWTVVIIRRMMMNRRNHRRLLETGTKSKILLETGTKSKLYWKTGEWTAEVIKFYWKSGLTQPIQCRSCRVPIIAEETAKSKFYWKSGLTQPMKLSCPQNSPKKRPNRKLLEIRDQPIQCRSWCPQNSPKKRPDRKF